MVKGKTAAVYARVSTSEQTVENQLIAIRQFCSASGWKMAETYQDVGVSGAQENRPALDQLKKDCLAGKFDCVVVYKFDRMARSVSHLLECLELFRKRGIDFVSISEGIDTSCAVGKMVFTFLGAVAEFERSLITERVNAGIRRAKAEGKHCGRPRIGLDLGQAIALRKQGRSVRDIAKEIHVSTTTVFRCLKTMQAFQ